MALIRFAPNLVYCDCTNRATHCKSTAGGSGCGRSVVGVEFGRRDLLVLSDSSVKRSWPVDLRVGGERVSSHNRASRGVHQNARSSEHGTDWLNL